MSVKTRVKNQADRATLHTIELRRLYHRIGKTLTASKNLTPNQKMHLALAYSGLEKAIKTIDGVYENLLVASREE
ncbi:MAG: hypothetical protein AB7L09_21495 [Nitrospira sp.]